MAAWRWVTRAGLVAGLVGCGNIEVAKLEGRQEELSNKFDNLQLTVREMRKEMVDVGLIAPSAEGEDPFKVAKSKAAKSGKAPGLGQDNQVPKNELGGEWSHKVRRVGTASPLPSLGTPERDEELGCAWKFTVPTLKVISNVALAKHDDVGKASPIELLLGGQPLQGHALNPHLESCVGRFRHAGNLIQFSTSGAVDDALSGDYALRLSESMPLPRGGDGRPMYWVYPGTTLEVDLGAWKDPWGDISVDLALLAAGDGTGPVRATVGGETVELEGTGELGHSVQPDVQRAPWQISIASPVDGPFVVLTVLTIGNPENALVVTGERAFKAQDR